MILVNELMPLTVLADAAANKEFVDMFMVVIQFGSILAVLLLYFHKLNPFSPRKNAYEKRSTIDLWLKVIVAVSAAGIIGVLFDDPDRRIFLQSRYRCGDADRLRRRVSGHREPEAQTQRDFV